MATETSTIDNAVDDVDKKAATVKKTTARKTTAAKKTATRTASSAKSTARKTTRKVAKKVEAEKSSFSEFFSEAKLKETREKMKEQADKMSDVLKNVIYLQLGVYGKIYDEMTSLIEKRKKSANKQWDLLVSRGEKVQKELEKSQSKITKRVKGFDVKGELKDGVEKFKDGYKDTVSKVKDFAKDKKAA